GLTARMQVAPLRERDQLLRDGTNLFRFRFRRLNPLVDEQIGDEIAEQRLAGAGIAAQLLVCGHGICPSLAQSVLSVRDAACEAGAPASVFLAESETELLQLLLHLFQR